jgi:hypothetical protein
VLVEILVIIAIIALVVVGYYGLSSEGEGEAEKPSTPRQAIDRGKAVECASNLRSLRSEIELFYAEHGRYPEKFNPSGDVGTCPVSGKPYVYDPQTTRKIYCTTPGHEQL